MLWYHIFFTIKAISLLSFEYRETRRISTVGDGLFQKNEFDININTDNMLKFKIDILCDVLNFKSRKKLYFWKQENNNLICCCGGNYQIVITNYENRNVPIVQNECNFSVGFLRIYIRRKDGSSFSYEDVKKDENFFKIWKTIKTMLRSEKFWKIDYLRFYEDDFKPLF